MHHDIIVNLFLGLLNLQVLFIDCLTLGQALLSQLLFTLLSLFLSLQTPRFSLLLEGFLHGSDGRSLAKSATRSVDFLGKFFLFLLFAHFFCLFRQPFTLFSLFAEPLLL